jgi:hypothetical protein
MMMFKTILVASIATLIGSTLGRALPYQQQEIKLAVRDISVIGVRSVPIQVPEIVVRGEHVKRVAVEERQIAEEDAVKTAPDGTIVNYVKRQVNTMPAEVATKSDGGAIVAYDKRQISPDIATKSDGGAIVAYPKRQNEPIPAEKAVKSENGVIVEY